MDGGVSSQAIDLGPAGHTGADLVFYHVAGDFFLKHFHELGTFRSRAHQGHAAEKDIEELRELVDGSLSDKFSDLCDSRVSRGGPAFLLVLRLLLYHGAEFVHHEGLVVKSHSFLFEDDGARGGEFDDDGNYKHYRAEEYDAHQGSNDVYNSLGCCFYRICKGHVSDVYDRKSVHVFSDGAGGDDIVIIRDELCVYAGFLAYCHDAAEFFIGCQGQSDGDLVDCVCGEDFLQFRDSSDDFHSFVGGAGFCDVVHDSEDFVAPVGVSVAGVDEFVRYVGEAYQHDVFLVKAFAAESREDESDAESFHCCGDDVDYAEGGDHPGGEVGEVA